MTHVVAAGPKNAPALVLLHGYMATSVMWAPNIADFRVRDYRVYATDVMGQPSKSVPSNVTALSAVPQPPRLAQSPLARLSPRL
jgi:alpha-beta hydrolase superfamily lysophospholipase